MTKVALITGGGRGIGRAVAQHLAREGWSCAVMARSRAELDETVASLDGPAGLAIPGSVTEAGDAAAAVDQCVAQLGGLDVLVNNAGVFRTAPLPDTTPELWNQVIDTNLTGAFLMARAAVSAMTAGGQGGMIVNVSSTAGRQGFPGSTAYCASKFGLMGLTEALREELRPQGIRVVAVLPGQVDTAAWDECGLDLAALGIKRDTMMRPAEVANAIALAVLAEGSGVAEEIVLRPPAG